MRLNVLFDMVHPADVHFFKYCVLGLIERGDRVMITSREKDITLELLQKYMIPHTVISKKGKGAFGLFIELFKRDYNLFKLARQFKPDIFISNNSPCGSHVAKLMGKPSIVFEDTEIHRYNQILYLPVVTEVHSPDCYRHCLGSKHNFYPGYHTLAYLHPDHFTPDPKIFEKLSFEKSSKIVLFRFVEWGAMHDIGLKTLSIKEKIDLINEVSNHAHVLISSETVLPPELEPFRLKLPVEAMHDLLAHVDLIVGESATMCSEAVVLGIPSIYIDEKGRGYTDDHDLNFGLCFNFKTDQKADIQSKAIEILTRENWNEQFKKSHDKMMKLKINVSAYQMAQIDSCVRRYQKKR